MMSPRSPRNKYNENVHPNRLNGIKHVNGNGQYNQFQPSSSNEPVESPRRISTKIRLLRSKLFTKNQDLSTNQGVQFNEKNEIFEYNYNPQVKYKIAKLREVIKTAEDTNVNKTFKIKLDVGIGKNSKHSTVVRRKGIAKERADFTNVSAENLKLKKDVTVEGGENPRMLARQVASWKVARALDIRVLSNEKYALDGEKIYGVSSKLPKTAQSLSREMAFQLQLLEGSRYTSLEKEQLIGEAVFTPAIQKQLSDLQLIDALVGQTDRHHGNIFIDIANDKIYGIDNDQAFFNTKNMDLANQPNIAISWLIPSKKVGSFPKYDPTQELVYTQSQVDTDTADKVLGLTSDHLREILEDKVGKSHGEFLTEDEIDAAVKRLELIQTRITQLKTNKELITTWDKNTFMASIEDYGTVQPFLEGGLVSYRTQGQRFQNYVAREIYETVHNVQQNGVFVQYEDKDKKSLEDLNGIYGNNVRIDDNTSDDYYEILKFMTRDDIRQGRRGLTEKEQVAYKNKFTKNTNS